MARSRISEDSSPPRSPSPSEPAVDQHQTLPVRDKRKHRGGNGAASSRTRRRTRDSSVEDENGGADFFDPDQSLEERRKVQRGFRDLMRDINDNAEEYMQANSAGLNIVLEKANALSKNVKQTAEAAIDSRLLVSAADLSYRRTLRLTAGNVAQGVDIDEFVSKCITYMRHGRGIQNDDATELTSTQRRRRDRDAGEEDDEDDNGDMMNWAHLGRFACVPNIRRPALPGFLLGPLSVEKKARKIVKRSAPFRPNNLEETRPEVIQAEDLARSEKNDLTVICSKILRQLKKVQTRAQQAVEAEYEATLTESESRELMDRHGLRETGGIDLLRFVVNPKSFGQTVENMFYVSFLIRDGRIGIQYDDNGLPALEPIDREETETGAVRHGTMKHQAIMSMDMATWREVINTFGIKEPMIEHRIESHRQGPGARGWYS